MVTGHVVDEVDGHVGAEATALDVTACQTLHLGHIQLVEVRGKLVTGRTHVAGAVALAGGGEQGKLAHGEHVAPYVEKRAVHHSLIVIEYPERHRLGRQAQGILVGIVHIDSHKRKQSCAYRAASPRPPRRGLPKWSRKSRPTTSPRPRYTTTPATYTSCSGSPTTAVRYWKLALGLDPGNALISKKIKQKTYLAK